MHCFPLLAVFVGGEIVDMISNSGAVAKLVLLALLAFSLISWSIILTKWSRLRRARAQSGGAATLRAVAPGISEALITTAAGLAAAIPAVIAYNLIGASIREFAARSDDFALEVLNAVEHSQAQAPTPAEMRR